MKKYTLSVMMANGAFVLRSSIEQDKCVNYGEMLKALKVLFPTAEWCLAFRTFDGDSVVQFKVKNPMCGWVVGLSHGAKLEF